ncbi:MAG: histidine--tRNA ligase [Parcubacteria group bacterium CG08_land_8_20_14_0_20_38_56]|nr:MAG: histidine--tRNA ligase [Parcubacteria group bacterium CG08_land_8_20_14_0_20_38_56]
MAKKFLQTPQGMPDILPKEQIFFERVLAVVKDFAHFYGFKKIDTPILEFTELFEKGIGYSSDIVEKEMYTFETRGGDSLTLRPEGTAPIARVYLQHGMQNLPQPLKLYYWGPFFRHERPQEGRYRQFHQFGFEVLGEQSPAIDAQVVQLSYRILEALKIKPLTILINSIGCNLCRPYFKKVLKNYYNARAGQICPDCKKRLKKNPLRVLDCKEEKCQQVKNQAPKIIDHLCEECKNHFREVLEFLDEVHLPYILDHYLVRGLDYYTRTVFEIVPVDVSDFGKGKEFEAGSQATLVGGGRYDDLIKLFSRKEVPAMGSAGGIERIIKEMKLGGERLPHSKGPAIFLAQLGDLGKRKSLKLFEDFQKAKILVAESFGRDSIKSQLKIADKLRVKYTLILGQKEALDGTIILREMESGRQEIMKLDKVVDMMKKRLKR